MTGMAASQYAGPAVLISFIIAAVACLFTALCYGELAASMPVSGSAYSYAYVSMGERAAWVTGWLLLLEYGISCIAVASGLSGYASSLAGDFHIHVPAWFYTPPSLQLSLLRRLASVLTGVSMASARSPCASSLSSSSSGCRRQRGSTPLWCA